jgi:hypothetical protein
MNDVTLTEEIVDPIVGDTQVVSPPVLTEKKIQEALRREIPNDEVLNIDGLTTTLFYEDENGVLSILSQ